MRHVKTSRNAFRVSRTKEKKEDKEKKKEREREREREILCSDCPVHVTRRDTRTLALSRAYNREGRGIVNYPRSTSWTSCVPQLLHPPPRPLILLNLRARPHALLATPGDVAFRASETADLPHLFVSLVSQKSLRKCLSCPFREFFRLFLCVFLVFDSDEA